MERGMKDAKSGTFTVNGAQRTELVIYMPGTKERFVINDNHSSSGSMGQPLYTLGKKASSGILNSRMKFSNIMNKLKDSHDEKMLMKQHEKEEKKWKKQEEKDKLKEEKHLPKEERKRLAAERRLKTNTLPQNFSFRSTPVQDNVSVTSGTKKTSNMYKRSLLSFNMMPKISEDSDGGQSEDPETMETIDNSKDSKKTIEQPMDNAPPFSALDISSRTRSIFSNDPDLQRIEQIYGATLRGVPAEISRDSSYSFITDTQSKDIVIENLFAHKDNFMSKKSTKKRAPAPPTQETITYKEWTKLSSNRQSFSAENAAIDILDDAIDVGDLTENEDAEPTSVTNGDIIEMTHL